MSPVRREHLPDKHVADVFAGWHLAARAAIAIPYRELHEIADAGYTMDELWDCKPVSWAAARPEGEEAIMTNSPLPTPTSSASFTISGLPAICAIRRGFFAPRRRSEQSAPAQRHRRDACRRTSRKGKPNGSSTSNHLPSGRIAPICAPVPAQITSPPTYFTWQPPVARGLVASMANVFFSVERLLPGASAGERAKGTDSPASACRSTLAKFGPSSRL